MDCCTPGFPILHISWSLLKLMSIESMMPSYHLIPFSSCLQSFQVSRSFPISWLLASGGQSVGASASVLPTNIQGWFPLGLTVWMSLQSKGLSSLLQHHSSKAWILWWSAFFMVQLSQLNMTTRKTIALTIRTFACKVKSLIFNTPSSFCHCFSSKEQES